MAETKAPDTKDTKAPVTTEQKVEILESVAFDIIDRLEKLTAQVEGIKKTAVTKPKGLFGGKREPVPIKDLLTGNVYWSMAQVNKVYGPEIGIDPLVDTLGYYKIEKKLLMEDGSKRFVPAGPEEAAAAREKYKQTVAEDVARRNAELEAAEQANAKAAEQTSMKAEKKDQPKKK